jgi:hypothetical protein
MRSRSARGRRLRAFLQLLGFCASNFVQLFSIVKLQKQRRASVSGVVGMPCEYCKCTVELFRQHQAGEFVG